MEEESNMNSTSINDLPKDLLLKILTSLPTMETIRAALVSRKWLNLWCSMPSLSFSQHLFSPHHSLSVTREPFAQSVHTITSLRLLSDVPLQKFYLQFYFGESRHNLRVSTWLILAMEHQVQELELDFSKGPDYTHCSYFETEDDDEDDFVYYNFDITLLKNSCVKVLKLSTCDIIPYYNVSDMQFVSLRSMFLYFVQLTDDLIVDILSGCVNLEALELVCCYGMKDVKISSLRLKELTLQSFSCEEGSVEIVAPRLQSFSIIFFRVGKYVLKDGMSLVDACVTLYGCYWRKVIKLLGHVKRLRVTNYWSEFVAAKGFLPESTVFYNLHYLNLYTQYSNSHMLGLATLFQLTPNLETMILYRQIILNDEFQESTSEDIIDEQIKFSLPNLRKVKINSFRGTNNELHLVKLLKKHAVVLEELELVPACNSRLEILELAE